MLKNTIKLLSFLGLMSLFIIIDFNLFRFYFSTTSTIILIINCVFYGSILLLQGFILGSIGGQFSKPKEPESSSQITTIQNHVDDLKNYIFRPLDLKQTHFEMLEQIANLINKNIVETNESIIESLYSELIKSGELKIRKVA